MNEVDLPFLVFNESEWKAHGWWTEDELRAADGKGFIGMKHGVDCYLAIFLPANKDDHD